MEICQRNKKATLTKLKILTIYSQVAGLFLVLGLLAVKADADADADPEAFTEEVIEEEPNGAIDFSEAEEQEDGSLCVTKVKMVEKYEKQQVKECWHQNVTQCHETYVTEFKPNQERQCEENFWKACKITFKERSFNYTLTTCMTPLVKNCDPPKGYGAPEPKTVCKTWYESTCNTTYNAEEKPQTWCTKEPRKICAPDNCRIEPGEQICHDKVLESTVQKPEEVCDLQPQTQCRLVTLLVPHLESQTVCKDIPKEVCHLKLDHPKMVKKPVKLKWCTKKPEEKEEAKASYLPPPPPAPQYQAAPSGYQSSPSLPPVITSYPTPAPSVPVSPGPTASPIYYKPHGFKRHYRSYSY